MNDDLERYEVLITDRAQKAIDEFVAYIARVKQEPLNAGRILDTIEDAIDRLEAMPHRCPLAPENEYVEYTIRMLIVKKTLLILFRIDEDEKLVTVIGFRHGSHSPINFE